MNHQQREHQRWEQQSAAARCIRFTIRDTTTSATTATRISLRSIAMKQDNTTFHPIYTHQIFPNEYIPNCYPLLALLSNRSDDQCQQQQFHESYQNIAAARFALLIDIVLESSFWMSCDVHVTIAPINHQNDDGSTAMTYKKRKTMLHDKEQATDHRVAEVETSVDDNKESTKMVNDIITSLRPFLPPIQIITMTTTTVDDITSSSQVTSTSKVSSANATSAMSSTTILQPSPRSTITTTATSPFIHNDEKLNSTPSFERISEPFGTIIHEYEVTTTDTSSHADNVSTSHSFCITMLENDTNDKSSSSSSSTILKHYFDAFVQKLSYYYIENASEITTTNNNDQWDIALVFHKTPNQSNNNEKNISINNQDETNNYRYILIGYCTLYHFCNPFRSKKSNQLAGNTIVRICQMLFLPSYQRQGHGQTLMHTIFNYYCGDTTNTGNNKWKSTDIIEINVEDPAPAFSDLRLYVDYERFIKSNCSWFDTTLKNRAIQSNDGDRNSCDDENILILIEKDESFFQPLTDVQILRRIQTFTKITTQQIQMIYEIYKFYQLQEYIKTCRANTETNDIDSDGRIELFNKRYRLMVKQRLFEQNQEELLSYIDKAEMKQQLDEMYQSVQKQYERILVKIAKKC